MSPILGIYASQISGHLWEPAGAYDALWSTTLAAATSTITISNIPQTYKHLQIRGIARTSRSDSNQDGIKFRYNSDTGNNYATHYLLGNGSTTGSSGGSSVSYNWINGITSATTSANCFGAFSIDILDYANTNKNKTFRALSGREDNANTAGAMWFESGLWNSTSAISSITIFPNTGPNIEQYSSFSLYGVN